MGQIQENPDFVTHVRSDREIPDKSYIDQAGFSDGAYEELLRYFPDAEAKDLVLLARWVFSENPGKIPITRIPDYFRAMIASRNPDFMPSTTREVRPPARRG